MLYQSQGEDAISEPGRGCCVTGKERMQYITGLARERTEYITGLGGVDAISQARAGEDGIRPISITYYWRPATETMLYYRIRPRGCCIVTHLSLIHI